MPQRKFVTKAEFAAIMGVNKSQVTRAIATGRIKDTAKGMIHWESAKVDWENNRRDSLKGRGGIANNKADLDDLEDLKDVEDVPDITENDDEPVKVPKGKMSKQDRLQAAVLKEAEAKASLREMQALQRAGELFARNDILSAFGAILGNLKSAILAWPVRLAKPILGLFQEWLREQGIDVDASKFLPLETKLITLITKETNGILESLKRNEKQDHLKAITDK